MAARIRKTHQDDVRAKIQATQLVNRLTNHALGKLELSPSQVRSIEILLKKTIPDLSAVEHSGEMTIRTLAEELAELNGADPGSDRG